MSLALCLGALLSACDTGSTTDTGAAQALRDAAAKMRSVNSFQFTADITSGAQLVHVAGSFSAPNSLYEKVAVAGTTIELIQIGPRAYRRDSPTAAWRALTSSSSSAATDPRLSFSALGAASSVSVVGTGYQFSLSGNAASSLVNGSQGVSGTAVLANGLITDLQYQSGAPQVSVHLTYTAFNSTPAVTAPPT